MNLSLKILAAAALLVVIAAGAVFLVRALNPSVEKVVENPKNNGKKGDPDPDKKNEDKGKDQKGRTRILQAGPIKVPPDHPLQPIFKPINQPQFLKFVRQVGKTYHNKVGGTVTGRASKKDWGFQAAVNFTYIFVVETEGKILENAGNGFTEERTFLKVWEQVIPGDVLVGMSLPPQLTVAITLLGYYYGVPNAGKVVNLVNHKSIPIDKSWIDKARDLGIFKIAPVLDPATHLEQLKLFTQSDQNKLLEGKVVQIVFKDGEGVTQINTIKGKGLDADERDMIIRANAMLDYYIFPDREVLVGSQWAVPGGAFGSLLDPRLRGKPEGQVQVLRKEDTRDKGKVYKNLQFTSGQIVLKDLQEGNLSTGQLLELRGEAKMSDETGVVSSAHMTGRAKYEKVSQEHLLFEARFAANPTFDIRYECTVR